MERFERLIDDDLPDDLYRKYLKVSGFWGIINHCRETGGRSPQLIILTVLVILTYSPLIVSTGVALYLAEKNLEGITTVVLNPITGVQAVIKFLILWFKLQTHARLFELLKKNYISVVPLDKKNEAKEVLDNSIKEANLLIAICLTTTTLTVMVWNVIPLLRSEYLRLLLGVALFGEPPLGENRIFRFWYPVDAAVTPWGEIIYVYELWTCCLSGYLVGMLEAIATTFIMMYNTQLKVFQFSLSELKCTSSQSKQQTADLLVYIKEHQKLMEIGDEITSLYDFLISVLLGSGLFILTIAVFNFFLGTGKGDWVDSFKFVAFAVYELAEVSVYCYAGNKLQTTSEEVVFAAYSCDWYEMKPEFRRTLQLMMVRSGRNVCLTAGKTYPVNHETLNSILQIVYSTAMLMKNQDE